MGVGSAAPPSPLRSRAIDLCALATEGLDPNTDLARSFAQIETKLREPLRVAIGGRLKAGKSTLVNSLLGERIAPVDTGECTKSTYWFEYGTDRQIAVERKDGRSEIIGFERGAVPRELGVPPADIARVVVTLDLPRLREFTIIDSPGLETLNESFAEETKDLLGIHDTDRVAVAAAEALVFLMPQPKESDRVTLESFRAAFPGASLSAMNTVGVLSRIDTLTGDDDPWPAAQRHADRYGTRLKRIVATVVPVIGMLGETVTTRQLSTREFGALRDLASLDSSSWLRLSLDVQGFISHESCPVSSGDRRRLIDLLGWYGARRAVNLISSTDCRDLHDLNSRLLDDSGLGAVTGLLQQQFTDRADVLKVSGAIAQLSMLAYSLPPRLRGRLLRELELVEMSPELHRLAEMRLMRDLAAGVIRVTDEMFDEIRALFNRDLARLTAGLGPEATADRFLDHCLSREADWNGKEQTARASEAYAFRTIKLSYSFLRQAISSTTDQDR